MIRITKKCEICDHVMFWKLHQFHCQYCRHKVDLNSSELSNIIEHADHLVTVPKGVDA